MNIGSDGVSLIIALALRKLFFRYKISNVTGQIEAAMKVIILIKLSENIRDDEYDMDINLYSVHM